MQIVFNKNKDFRNNNSNFINIWYISLPFVLFCITLQYSFAIYLLL